MISILYLLKFDYLTKTEQLNTFFLSKEILENSIHNKILFNIFLYLLKNNRINTFEILLKKCIEKINKDKLISILTNQYNFINIVGINESVCFIEKCLHLNRIDFLKLIISKLGIIGNNNYYNLIFSDLHYSVYNQSKRIDLLTFLYNKNYKIESNYPNLEITNYTSRFLDVWKYSLENNTLKNKLSYIIPPLHNFAKVSNVSILKKYINFFTERQIYNVNTLDLFNRTPLTYAIEYQNMEYIHYLLNNKCSIECVDKFNCNIFHYLCIQDNTYDNNLFFSKFWDLIRYNLNIPQLLATKNIKQYTPIDYLLYKGRFCVFRQMYNFKYFRCNNIYIDMVHQGFKQYFNNSQNNRNVENTYQFKEYLKLTKLIIKECMDFKMNDLMNDVKNSDIFYKVCKYLG